LSPDSPCQGKNVAYNFFSARDYYCEHVVAVIAAAAAPECFDQFTTVKVENCDKEKDGVAAHSRSAGQELDLICNNNFV
jgi:hypothetical protein